MKAFAFIKMFSNNHFYMKKKNPKSLVSCTDFYLRFPKKIDLFYEQIFWMGEPNLNGWTS